MRVFQQSLIVFKIARRLHLRSSQVSARFEVRMLSFWGRFTHAPELFLNIYQRLIEALGIMAYSRISLLVDAAG